MGRCGCGNADACGCLITSEGAVEVTGSGTEGDPYVVRGSVIASSDSVEVSGDGTPSSPWRLDLAFDPASLTETIQDVVASSLLGDGVVIDYDDDAGMITVTGQAVADNGETIRDTIGTALVGLGSVTVIHNDVLDIIYVVSQATVNQTDEWLTDRANHHGTQPIESIEGLAEAIDAGLNPVQAEDTRDIIAGALVGVDGVTITPNDGADQIAVGFTGSLTSARILDFAEAAQDSIAAALIGSGVTIAYDDAANQIVFTATSGGTDLEAVRDAIGIALIGVGNISVTVDDAANTITVATLATQNSTDAALRDRASHTGEQAIATITGLVAALAGKSPIVHNHPVTDLITTGTRDGTKFLRDDGVWAAVVGGAPVVLTDTIPGAPDLTSLTVVRETPGAVNLNDTFDRANTASGLGTATTGQAWDVSTSMAINSGKAYAPTGNGMAVIETGASDGTVYAVPGSGTSAVVMIVFRYVDAANYWYWQVGQGTAFPFPNTLTRVVGGSAATIATVNQALGTQTVSVELNGTSMTLRFGNTVVDTRTSGTHQTATKHGIGILEAAGRWESFSFIKTANALPAVISMTDIKRLSSASTTVRNFLAAADAAAARATIGAAADGGLIAAPFVGVKARRSTAQSIPNSAFTTASAVAFNDPDEWDTLDVHSPTVNPTRFTIPQGGSGKWTFVFSVSWESKTDTNGRWLIPFKNGAGVDGQAVTTRNDPTSGINHQVVVTVDLVAGDYMEFTAIQNSGGAVNVTSATLIGRLDTSAVATLGPTQWASYTPVLAAAGGGLALGSGASITGRYRLNGNQIEGTIRVKFGAGMTPGTGVYTLSLPSSVAMPVTDPNAALGSGWVYDNSAAVIKSTMVAAESATTMRMYLDGATLIQGTAPWTWAADDIIDVQFRAELVSGGGHSVTTPLLGNTATRARLVGTGTNFAHGAWTSVPWDTEDFDDLSCHDSVTNPSRLTAPATGRYRLTASVGLATVKSMFGRVLKNGTDALVVTPAVSLGVGTNGQAGVSLNSGIVALNAGDYVEVQAYQIQASGSAASTVDTGVPHFVCLERIV